MVASSVWKPVFRKALDRHPKREQRSMHMHSPICDACRISGRVATIKMFLQGDRYDPDTFTGVVRSLHLSFFDSLTSWFNSTLTRRSVILTRKGMILKMRRPHKRLFTSANPARRALECITRWRIGRCVCILPPHSVFFSDSIQSPHSMPCFLGCKMRSLTSKKIPNHGEENS